MTIVLALWFAAFAPVSQPAPELVRTIAIRLADGRVLRLTPTHEQPRGSGWTSLVPKIAGASTVRDGLEVSALDYARAIARAGA